MPPPETPFAARGAGGSTGAAAGSAAAGSTGAAAPPEEAAPGPPDDGAQVIPLDARRPQSKTAPAIWPTRPGAAPGRPGQSPWPPAPPAPAAEAPPSRAAKPGEPFYQPQASWRWHAAVAGLVAGAAPQAILQISSMIAGGTPSAANNVSAAGAISIAVSALILYSWQAFSAWLFSLRKAGRSLALWGFRRPTKAYFWVVPVGLFACYALGIVHDMIVHPHQQRIISEFPHTAVGGVMFVLVAVVMAPIFEEILFRGFLFRGLANSLGWFWGAVISATLFGAAHLQLDVFLPLAALGFALAWAYHRTGSLWTNITMHAIFNTIAVIAWAITR